MAASDAVRQPARGVPRLWGGLAVVAARRGIAARWSEAAAVAAAAGASGVFAHVALARQHQFESTAYDLGFFDQIIWNTAHGRWFDTSFTSYNFLGQHFQPVLLAFALAYRLGAGIELLLLAQSVSVAAAAVPLYYAVRRLSGSGAAGLALSVAFLLSAPLHGALDFDFHPEMMAFLPAFVALYFLAARRPVAVIASLAPLLLLKEDMPLILGAFAVLLWLRGARREGLALLAIAAAWAATIVLVVMPAIRGGGGDLTARYGYLVAGSDWQSLAPDVLGRSVMQLWGAPLEAALRLGATSGFAAVLAPAALAAGVPAYLLAALSDHPQQSQLELHYVVAPLAIVWVAAALGAGRLIGRLPRPLGRVLPVAVLACSIATFLLWSPYAPVRSRSAPGPAEQAALEAAVRLVPGDAAVSAQTTIVPHLSRRVAVYEFPDVRDATYVLVDRALPVTAQSREAGYARALAELPDRGFELVFDRAGVRVYRRAP